MVLDISVRMFLEEINIWKYRLKKDLPTSMCAVIIQSIDSSNRTKKADQRILFVFLKIQDIYILQISNIEPLGFGLELCYLLLRFPSHLPYTHIHLPAHIGVGLWLSYITSISEYPAWIWDIMGILCVCNHEIHFS